MLRRLSSNPCACSSVQSVSSISLPTSSALMRSPLRGAASLQPFRRMPGRDVLLAKRGSTRGLRRSGDMARPRQRVRHEDFRELDLNNLHTKKWPEQFAPASKLSGHDVRGHGGIAAAAGQIANWI